jgi:hypothetical protein
MSEGSSPRGTCHSFLLSRLITIVLLAHVDHEYQGMETACVKRFSVLAIFKTSFGALF